MTEPIQSALTQPCLIGCCGWNEAKAKYFAHFNVVELQSTFYEPPSLSLASKWRALAPESFHFCLKAWQLITHTPASPTYRRLKSHLSPSEHNLLGFFRPTEQVSLAWERTAQVAHALRARVVLFQCPASFRPDAENIKNLRNFFSLVKRSNLVLAWEPRGDWPQELVHNLCQDLNLVHCIDPLQSVPTSSETVYWRLHGKGGYSYRYSDQDLQQLVTLFLRQIPAQTQSAYILFNNIWMKDDALRFQAQLPLL